jgi:hypothetical protein
VARKAITEQTTGGLSGELVRLWEALAAATVGAGTCT